MLVVINNIFYIEGVKLVTYMGVKYDILTHIFTIC